jgi:predicted double-glycine peptidase
MRDAPRASSQSAETSATRQRPTRRKANARLESDAQEQSTTRRRSARRQQDDAPLDLGMTSPRLSLPSLPVPTPARRRKSGANDARAAYAPTEKRPALREQARISHSLRDVDDEWEQGDWRDHRWEDEPDEQPPPPRTGGRLRSASSARPITALTHVGTALIAAHVDTSLSTHSVPELVAYRAPRPHLSTRAILRTARKPWSVTRMICVALAIIGAILTGAVKSGEASQPLMLFNADAGSGPAVDFIWPVNAVTARVQPQTQGKRVDLFDSVEQYNQWWGAACSAAVLSEVLTAYNVPNITIGKMIDELGGDISPYGGLMTYDGFNRVAAIHGFRADMYVERQLTLNQMKYLTNTLGVPVIVNVRISWGYYHFFGGGHFMVLTAIDDQGARLVDSSLYFVKYMPMGVFNSMFTGRTAVIVPKAYVYTLPQS